MQSKNVIPINRSLPLSLETQSYTEHAKLPVKNTLTYLVIGGTNFKSLENSFLIIFSLVFIEFNRTVQSIL